MDADLGNQSGLPTGLRSALFVIASDPLTSPRPAEAVRIAAGLGSWQRIRVHVYVHDAALEGLTAAPGQVRDEECFHQYLPLLVENNPQALLVSDRARVEALETDRGPVALLKTSDQRLAALALKCSWVMRF